MSQDNLSLALFIGPRGTPGILGFDAVHRLLVSGLNCSEIIVCARQQGFDFGPKAAQYVNNNL